ncbi:MBL fold metallo-hydrolase [Paenibacillus sp. S-38]|uniref:MBL fold metallo-hydrolase n=1 Tax=Paenibacillus sp. S-38 TaxID=3416710 RepID=UPI003CF0AFA5
MKIKGRYENMDGIRLRKKLPFIQKWRKERKKIKLKDWSYMVPQCAEKQIEFLKSNHTEPTMTWIGHSSFLLQMEGKNLLTDPVWAQRMGLEKRLTPPGLMPADLPRIDAVLLSHSHYDHMDMPSLRTVHQHNPGVQMLVPVGLGKKLRSSGFHKITEVNWWDTVRLDGLELHFVPAQHWTRRTLFDTNASHWGGWVLRPVTHHGERLALYFVGDSAYFGGFKTIGERFRIGWALMPIGAYDPEWYTGKQHVNPEEAVQAFIDCGAQVCVPMHYGTFRLADDTPREALDRLHAAWERHGLAPERLRVLTFGETIRPLAETVGAGG